MMPTEALVAALGREDPPRCSSGAHKALVAPTGAFWCQQCRAVRCGLCVRAGMCIICWAVVRSIGSLKLLV